MNEPPSPNFLSQNSASPSFDSGPARTRREKTRTRPGKSSLFHRVCSKKNAEGWHIRLGLRPHIHARLPSGTNPDHPSLRYGNGPFLPTKSYLARPYQKSSVKKTQRPSSTTQSPAAAHFSCLLIAAAGRTLRRLIQKIGWTFRAGKLAPLEAPPGAGGAPEVPAPGINRSSRPVGSRLSRGEKRKKVPARATRRPLEKSLPPRTPVPTEAARNSPVSWRKNGG